MKNKWLPNFSSIKDGQITIKHRSTSSTIEIILDDPENIGPFSIWLDYGHFDSLIECIKSLETDDTRDRYLSGVDKAMKDGIDGYLKQ